MKGSRRGGFPGTGIAALLGFFSVCLAAPAWSGEGPLPLRRLALFVGSNDGGAGRVTLRYAEEDARTMAGVMQEMGGVAAADSLVLLAPTPDDLLEGLRAIGLRAQQAREGSRRVEFLLYYSGHSDEEGLLLGGETMGYPRLRAAIQGVQSDVNIAILDSCSSGAFTRLKGGTRQPPFLVDESSQMRGHAYLSSSSADEAAQESDRIQSSFFTHYLISGLRGAADSTRDGQVSLNEAYHFAFSETLARTEGTQAGPQHPSYNIQLTGTGDLTLTDLRVSPCGLGIEEAVGGRLFVRGPGGRLLVELSKEPGFPVELGLPEGRYTVTLEQGARLWQASVSVKSGSRTELGLRQFVPVRREATAARGTMPDGEEGPRPPGEAAAAAAAGPATEPAGAPPATVPAETRVPFNLGFVPSISIGGAGSSERVVYNLSVNVLVGSNWAVEGAEAAGIINIDADRVRGLQAAGVGNIVGGELRGLQAAGVFNIISGRTMALQSAGVFNIVQAEGSFLQSAGVFNLNEGAFTGILAAGVFNIGRGPVSGLQTAGVFNILEGPLSGAQAAGVFNVADRLSGFQVGLVNIASGDVRGAQVGLVNIASGEVRGSQVGLVNVSRRLHGLPVGLVNVAREGEFHVSGWVTTTDTVGYMALQMLAGRGYTLLYAGAGFGAGASPAVIGAGLGLRLPLGPFHLDTDLSAQHVSANGLRGWGESFRTAPYSPVFPSARLTLGLKAAGPLGVFGGVVLNGHIPGATAVTPLHTGDPLDLRLGRGHLLLYPRLLAGLSF